jgi:hypothetical protein
MHGMFQAWNNPFMEYYIPGTFQAWNVLSLEHVMHDMFQACNVPCMERSMPGLLHKSIRKTQPICELLQIHSINVYVRISNFFLLVGTSLKLLGTDM